MRLRSRDCCAFVTWAFLADPHAAASPAVDLRIPAEPVERALIDFALQAGVSLGGPLHQCTGTTSPVAGIIAPSTALEMILRGSNCAASMPDGATVVVAVTPPAAAPSTRIDATASEAIVVTATRRPQLPGATPYALTGIGSADLVDRRLHDMQDLAPQVAAMSVTNLGPGRNKIILRGISDGTFTGLAQSPVAIYLGDSPVTYNSPDPDLRLADVQRVEVLRGPQGVLYGGGAIGGVVRIIPGAPDFDRSFGYLSGSLSSTRRGGLNDGQEAMINQPIVPGVLAVRAVAYREGESGYFDDVGRPARKVNNSVREGGRAALALKLSETWDLTLSGAVQSIETADTHYGLRRLPAYLRDQLVLEPHDNDFSQGALVLEGHDSWGSLSASATYLLHSFQSRYDASPVMATYGARGVGVFDESKDISLTALNVTFASPHGRFMNWLVGAAVSSGRTTYASSITRLSPTTRVEYTEHRQDTELETAFYGEMQINLTDQLCLSAGGRLFQFRIDTQSVVVEAAGERAFAGKDVDGGFSPKLVVQYDPAENVILYAEAAGGYRGGGFNTSGRLSQSFGDSGSDLSREYRPDTIWNYEAGAKMRLLEDSVQLRIAAFIDRWRDIQSDQFQTSGLPLTANVGDGDVRGIELEASWRAMETLDLGVSALAQDSDLTNATQLISPRPDVGLPGTPTISAAASFDYHRTLSFGATLRLQGDVSYIGHSFLTFDDQQLYDMGGYATVRLSTGLEFDGYSLTAFVDNLTDNAANTFAFGNPFQMRTDPEVTPLTPRTFGFQVRAEF